MRALFHLLFLTISLVPGIYGLEINGKLEMLYYLDGAYIYGQFQSTNKEYILKGATYIKGGYEYSGPAKVRVVDPSQLTGSYRLSGYVHTGGVHWTLTNTKNATMTMTIKGGSIDSVDTSPIIGSATWEA